MATPTISIEITDWLRNLGLEQYAPAFRDNAIDASLLPSLTAEDLKDLGVTLVGHRRRLLDAITAIGADVSDRRRMKFRPIWQHMAMLNVGN